MMRVRSALGWVGALSLIGTVIAAPFAAYGALTGRWEFARPMVALMVVAFAALLSLVIVSLASGDWVTFGRERIEFDERDELVDDDLEIDEFTAMRLRVMYAEEARRLLDDLERWQRDDDQ